MYRVENKTGWRRVVSEHCFDSNGHPVNATVNRVCGQRVSYTNRFDGWPRASARGCGGWPDCTTEGAFVSCSVQGDIAHPRSISVQVWATPAQQIDVTWGDLCVNGFASGDRSGSFTVTAGALHKVTRNIPLSQGADGKCTPDVLVNPNGTGRIHVILFGGN